MKILLNIISFNLKEQKMFKMIFTRVLLLEVLMRRDNSRATRTQLDQNSTCARARLEMLTSRVEQPVTRLEKLARNSNIFVYKILKVFF